MKRRTNMSEEKDKASKVFTFAFYKLNEDDISEEDKELWQDIKDVADLAGKYKSAYEAISSFRKRDEDMAVLESRLTDEKEWQVKCAFLESRLTADKDKWHKAGYEDGYNEGLNVAAGLVMEWDLDDGVEEDIAEQILNLKEKKP